MNAEEFEAKTGEPPVQDDLERVNCKAAGSIGHWLCGYGYSQDREQITLQIGRLQVLADRIIKDK